MYRLYVQSHLDYGDVIYHFPRNMYEFSHCVKLTNQMEKLEAELAVACAWKGTSREKIYEELGWESLDLRRWSRRLVLFYEIINHLTPDYIRSPIPQRQESSYSLRKRTTIGYTCENREIQINFVPKLLAGMGKT